MNELLARMEHSLTNHAPKSEEVIDRFEAIRTDAKTLTRTILDNAPAGRELSISLTHLEETVMWAIKAIALNQ